MSGFDVVSENLSSRFDSSRSRTKLKSPAKLFRPPRVFSYAAARALLVLGTAAGVFWLNWLGARLVGWAHATDVLELGFVQCYWAVGLALTCWFVAHSASLAMLDSYAQGRMRLPEILPPSAAHASSPWTAAIASACTWGLGAAAISGWLVPRLFSHGVPLPQFAWQFAACTAALSVCVVLQHSGRRFIAQALVTPHARGFSGTHNAYLWQRHALPQALVNGFINGWIGLAIVPRTGASASFVLLDIVGALVALAFALLGPVYNHARFDRRWGVVARWPVSTRELKRQATSSFIALAALAALGCVSSGLGSRTVGLETYVVARTLGCAAYSGVLAYWVARWALRLPDEPPPSL